MAGAGFGWGSFGAGGFGEARWSYEAFWKSLPDTHREEDRFNDDLLFKLIQGWAKATDLLRRQARTLPDQRDARRARTRFNENAEITIKTHELSIEESVQALLDALEERGLI